jgi:hypothetical protein
MPVHKLVEKRLSLEVRYMETVGQKSEAIGRTIDFYCEYWDNDLLTGTPVRASLSFQVDVPMEDEVADKLIKNLERAVHLEDFTA